MFDEASARLIRDAPSLRDLPAAELPAVLANAYAGLVSRRLSGESVDADATEEWPLTRIADVYELIASVSDDGAVRRSAAFVAGSAQRLQSAALSPALDPLISREAVHPSISAPLLFLIAEQYADAADAANEIPRSRSGGQTVDTLVACLAELSRGRPGKALDLSSKPLADSESKLSLEERATETLLRRLIEGIRQLARALLGLPGDPSTPSAVFSEVVEIAAQSSTTFGDGTFSAYPGPSHLAELLRTIAGALPQSSIASVPGPPSGDSDAWGRWLRRRARRSPFIWPNHREALLEQRFQDPGKSAVIVYPTGAGKTTLTSFKVQATLLAGQKVVFLAPTHALAEQLTRDFHAVFAERTPDAWNVILDSGSDTLANLEVMTPERCLARLSHSPEAFEEVGLLVFDECHLLSPDSGVRRSLDAMLCLLAFNAVQPDADLLLLSAMLTNGELLAGWISELTGRECSYLESFWKPTRQARAVVTYLQEEIEEAKKAAADIQRQRDTAVGRAAADLRMPAKRMLTAVPYGLFGLQHNWRDDHGKLRLSLGRLSTEPVSLAGRLTSDGVYVTPNSNEVASQLAIKAVASGLKTMIFVNSRRESLAIARNLSQLRPERSKPDEEDAWAAIADEFGGLDHSVLKQGSGAVPHNALMIRSERELAEALFRRKGGADVIVATPTLAQGLNLPASLAILAGDKRMDQASGQRTLIKAHELLNAAGRAGRAGHLANGVVLLVPEPVVTMPSPRRVSKDTLAKLRSVMPSNDRCLEIRDPLEYVLDSVSTASEASGDVEYSLNRMLIGGEEAPRFGLQRSLAAYHARTTGDTARFQHKVEQLESELARRSSLVESDTARTLSARTGVSPRLITQLIERINSGDIPQSVIDWATWTTNWLADDPESLLEIVGPDSRPILRAAGRRLADPLDGGVISDLRDAIDGWLRGLPISKIESILTQSEPSRDDPCLRSRELILGFLPRAFSHAVGIATATALLATEFGPAYVRTSAEIAPIGVRDGLPSPVHVALARIRSRSTRRHIHQLAERLSGSLEVHPTDDYAMIFDRVSRVNDSLT